LQSDGGVREDGFYFDDFKIFFNEAPLGTPPVASFTPSTFESCEDEPVSFTDFSTEQPTNWSWSFGDGSTSSSQNPSHVYSNPGVYSITLEVTNQFGSSSAVQTVVVNEIPSVELETSDSDNLLCLNDASVQLFGTPSGVSFSGPGVNGTIFNPTAAGIGVHVIQGEYTDANGCTGFGTVEITVDGCVSITDLAFFGVRLFPNPNNGRFSIEGLSKGSTYQIFDMNGRMLFSGMVTSSVQELDLNLSCEGLFYIQSEVDGHLSRMRFMVLN
jgi:PKD repeat protein